MFKELHNEVIGFPVNIKQEHKQYFEQCLQWQYYIPIVKDHFFSFLYLKGYGTSFLLQPIKNTEPWADFYQYFNKSFFLGRIVAAVKKRKMKAVFTREYYYCTNEFSNNFFHWFAEVLPKMVYVKNHLKDDARFFIPFPLSDYQLASLNLCNINFYETKSEATFFYHLKVVENFAGSTGYYHRELLNETAQIIKNTFRYDEKKKRKIYVTRKNAVRRRILNEDELTRVLLQWGFEIFDFDEISYQQQVEILVSTSVFVSQHGAALTNMIYMQPESTIFELLPKEVMSDKCFFILAGILRHRYYYLFCETDGPSHITADFLVNIDSFETILLKAISGHEIPD